MNHLFSCLKKYRLEAILSPLFKLLEAGMELLVPLVVAAIIDLGIANADRGYIVHACLLLVGFGALGLAFALTAQYFAAKAAVGASAELRRRLFQKMQSFSFTQIDDMGTSSMLTRMTSDVNQVQSGVNQTLRLFLRSPIVVLGAAAMAFVVDVYVGLVLLAIIPLLFIVVFSVMAACLPRHKAVQEKLDGVYLSTRENLAGARVIRAFRMEEEETETFHKKSRALERAQVGVGRIAALTGSLTFVLVNLAAVALIWVGAVRVELGVLEQGEVVALYSYLSLILVELIKFANWIVNVTKAVTCMRRVGIVLDMEGEQAVTESDHTVSEGSFNASCGLPERKAAQGAPSDPYVVFENVTFTYAGGGAPALTDISFTAAHGETVGILGGTGAGKSTLVNLLPRFYEAERGRILIGGVPVGAIPLTELRTRTVGFVPQKAVLFRGTIASNLRWGNESATDEELLKAAALAQALDVIEAKGGLDAEIAQEGRNLSGGQRQRLTIARALAANPAILVLDDSASALDYATDARLRAALKTLDCTVFLVSQRVASVMHADKILVLDGGHIADMGSHDELMERCGLYREIYNSQTEAAS